LGGGGVRFDECSEFERVSVVHGLVSVLFLAVSRLKGEWLMCQLYDLMVDMSTILGA
jgi:hypothetical protein